MTTTGINFKQFSLLSANEKADFINVPLPDSPDVWHQLLKQSIVSQSKTWLLNLSSYPSQYWLLIQSFHQINEVNYHLLSSTNQI